MEKTVYGRESLELPSSLLDSPADVFFEVLSQSTWKYSLTDDQREHLQTFLPTFPENDADEKEETLKLLFCGAIFKFGNPVTQFRRKLIDGYLSPDIAKYSALCRRAKYNEYRYQQQKYYTKLLKDILLSRQKVFDQVAKLTMDEKLPAQYLIVPPREKSVQRRVKKHCLKLMREVREECGFEDTSSEEEEAAGDIPFKTKKSVKVSMDADVPSIMSTFSPRLTNGDFKVGENGIKLPTSSPIKITIDDYQDMLQRHRKRRADSEDSLDLDTRHLDLQDIILRTQPSKKGTFKPSADEPIHSFFPEMQEQANEGLPQVYSGPPAKKRLMKKDVKQRKMKLKNPKRVNSRDENTGYNKIDFDTDEMNADLLEDESLLNLPLGNRQTVKAPFKVYASFFSVLRDFICEQTEMKITTVKLEEKVREWQESPSSARNDWFGLQTKWVDITLSALKFLSGDVLGLTLDNFIPYVDYKERAQHWKWIGQGRDTDEQLVVICQHWLRNKSSLPSDLLDGAQGSPPPPKIRTDFIMRPSTDEEKQIFRDQEKMRFANPHRAFTYKLHGYTSVVGPVKGVYSRESAMNKAREHALLTSDRPAYVTILTLVRDAAARLPNGEGTRSDICELLKDSMFLATGVTDAQINTVVSGALDRLHYEKDPCVKYDVNRKIWIYLHRNRTENEFERIHQAQGAAAKAKKALQKPKSAKSKSKEIPTETTSVGLSNDSLSLGTSLSSSKCASNSPKSLSGTKGIPNSQAVNPISSQALLHPHLISIAAGMHKTPGKQQTNITITPSSGTKPMMLSPSSAQKPVAVRFIQPQIHGKLDSSSLQQQQHMLSSKPVAFGLMQASGQVKGVLSSPSSPRGAGQHTMLVTPEMTLQRVSPQRSSPNPSPSQHVLVQATSTHAGGTPVVARIIQHQGGPVITGIRQQAPGATIRIQGGNIVQGSKPIAQLTGGTPTASHSTAQLAVVTQLSGKPGNQTVTVSSEGHEVGKTHFLQSLASSGITLQTKDGKTHFVQSLGKPGQIATKPAQLTALIGGKPTQIIGQTIIGGKPQVVTKGSTAAALLAQLRSQAAVSGQQQPTSAGGTVISKIIQTSQAASSQTKHGSVIFTPVPTSLPCTSAVTTATKSGPTTKIVTLSQGSIASPQVFAQGTESKSSSPKEDKTSGSIQVMKTVLPSSGATLVWSQTASDQPVILAGDQKQIRGKSSPSKTKPGPVYARIITPPPGVRLTATLPGQQILQTSNVFQGHSEDSLPQQVTPTQKDKSEKL